MKVSAIIVAAGKGSRMKTSMNKQYLTLSKKPVLAHTLGAFEKSALISEIIVVIHQDDQKLFEDNIQNLCSFSKISAVVHGGADRQSSVYNGLKHVSDDADIIAVHDGARPLITPGIIAGSVEVADAYGVACVGVPVKDTIKKVNQDQIVAETPDRSLLWAVQTPQVFQRDILVKAHEKAMIDGFRGTDDSVLAERLGFAVHMVMGSYTNIKITTTEDLLLAQTLLKEI